MERSWVDRIPLAGWRGSATGIYDHDFKFWPLLRLIGLVPGRRNHRLKVCRLGETHPELLDAAISGFVQISESSEAQVRRAVRMSTALTAAAIDAWIQLLLLEWARARPRPEPHPGRVEVPTVDPGALPGPPPPP